MKKLLFILLLFVVGVAAFGQITFEKTYGGNSEDRGNDFQQTNDGGYILFGDSKSYGVGGWEDAYLIKTDSAGNIEWTSLIGNIDQELIRAGRQTTDGGYIFCGQKYPSGGPGKFYLVKTKANGDEDWSKVWGSSQENIAHSIEQTPDGGYIISGQSEIAGSQYLLLIKTSPSGNVLWTKSYPGFENGGIWTSEVEITNDNGFILVSAIDDGFTIYAVKTDALGNIQWSKTYGYGYGISVKQTADNGYIINTSTKLIKTNTNGDTLWTKPTFKGFGSIELTQDGGYLFSGKNINWDYWQSNKNSIFVIKTNSIGDQLWAKSFSHDIASYQTGYATKVKQTNDGGIAILGITRTTFSSHDHNYYFIKTDTSGPYFNSIIDYSSFSSTKVYPNPTTGKFRVESSEFGVETIEIYDLFGRKVLATKETEIDMSSYPAGMYVWQVGTARGKIVLE